ncbi:MAG: hypothetical protein ACO29O_07950 [Chitinophagaceae bacterium]
MVNIQETKEKIHQYEYECMMWTRSLEYLKQENAYLKDRLTEVVDHHSDKYFLAQAEHFQNQFIIKDEFLDELKHDVYTQIELLKKEINVSDSKHDDLTLHQDKLREQMVYIERDFLNLRNNFQNFLNTQITLF